MKHRKLRIAWSVSCGLVATLLVVIGIALSYRKANVGLFQRSGPGLTHVRIYGGELSLSFKPRLPYRPEWAGQIIRYGLRYTVWSNGMWSVRVPLWAVGVLFLPVGALPWISWRFSLRTLLLVTTILAVLLGVGLMILR